jgi:alginate O-acetyltransferase complex protein AlgI
LFTQLYFWIFFTVVFAGFSIIYPNRSARNAYLFFMSLFFYWKTSGLFFLLLLFSIICNYTLGIFIYKSKSAVLKKVFLILAVSLNLFLLSHFKYAEFFTDIVNSIFNTNFEAFQLPDAWNSRFDFFSLGLPIGISFFTFQTISYVVDLYKNKTSPVRSILDFGFYVSFFPQLLAGPIVRASDFIPQLHKRYKISKDEFAYALFLILNGLIKKIFIGDYLAVNLIDRVFANPLSYTGLESLIGLYGYSLQVYCDFSGYTDIAIGLALFMGFRLPRNFNSPYKAHNVGNFWKRWHISLSTWLKDYLYIPIGGNRNGNFRTSINIMLVMLLGGLWHGASWHFVIWGALNGIALLVHRYWVRISPYENSNHFLIRFWKIFLTFNFISLTRIWFRSDSMDHAWEMFTNIGTNLEIASIIPVFLNYKTVFFVMVLGYLLHWLPGGMKAAYRDWFIRSPYFLKAVITVIIIFIIYQAWSAELQPFIYFQF